MRDSARWLHANDPSRMVAVDVWGRDPPKHAGALYSEVDAVAETDYTGWYEVPHDTPAQLAARMRSRLAAMERTFPGKVLVISEFGAESNTLNKPGSPGQLLVPGAACCATTSRSTRPTRISPRCSCGCCATTPSRRASAAARSTA